MAPAKLHDNIVLSMQGFQRTRMIISRGKQSPKIRAVRMVGLTGFEPVTPRLSSACSNQLSYKPKKWWS